MAREDYIEVSVRIQEFYDKYPNGSLQGEWEYTNRDGEQWLVYKAYAYRTPDDPRPGIGFAWEPIPGRTQFTRGSELMNGETSAWGRALAALGIAVRTGIATANEIRAAEARQTEPTKGPEKVLTYTKKQNLYGGITEPQIKKLRFEMQKAHVDEVILNEFTVERLGFEIPVEGITALTKQQAIELIDAMVKGAYKPTHTIERTADPAEHDPWQVTHN